MSKESEILRGMLREYKLTAPVLEEDKRDEYASSKRVYKKVLQMAGVYSFITGLYYSLFLILKKLGLSYLAFKIIIASIAIAGFSVGSYFAYKQIIENKNNIKIEEKKTEKSEDVNQEQEKNIDQEKAIKQEQRTVIIGGIKFVFIQGGQFIMGSRIGVGQADEYPQHKVHVSSFWMGKYEITQKQYKMVMGKNPSHFFGDDNPVEMVSWKDAVQFCTIFSKKFNVRARLPYEAEWEYACRAGSKTHYYWGDQINRDYCWYTIDNLSSDKTTHSVGRKKPNSWGLYDMSGNVREWCMDWYKNSYYSVSPSNNPKGPDTGYYRVLRGGDWGNIGEYLRSGIRQFSLPDDLWSNNVGFRIVIEDEGGNRIKVVKKLK